MNLIIPIAGRGSRFKEEGFEKPKALIEVRGKPMIKWATDSISEIIEEKNPQIIFIVLKSDVERSKIDEKLKDLYGEKIKIKILDKVTEGAVITVLKAKEMINNDEELIIYNGDQFFKAPILETLKNLEDSVKGLIPVFHSTQSKWSFVKTDSDGFVIETAEKRLISTNATVGFYYFKYGKDFVWAAEEIVKKDLRRNNEFFVCPTYNELVKRGDKIRTVKCEFMWGLGSPEGLKHFEKYYKENGNGDIT